MATEDVDDFLEHYGVAGMKWGKRKAAAPSGDPKKPSYAAAAIGGAVANSKSRFTNPAALKQRTTAGKLFAASIASSLGSTALSMVAMNSNNQSVKAGAALASKLLNATAAGTGAGSLVLGINAVKTERDSRSS